MYPGKRSFDLIAGLLGLVVFGLPMLIVAGLVRLTGGGPALYQSVRVGRNGQDFLLLKFRTMVVDADRVGPSSTSTDDPRITRIGGFLRRTKLDELPQLLNVVRGDMSLVGPRPQVRWAVDRYDAGARRLLELRPGITDYASIVYRDEAGILAGHADPDQAYLELIEPGKIRLGLAYLERASLREDLRILFMTLGAVAGREAHIDV